MLSGLFREMSPRPVGLTRIVVGFAAVIRVWMVWSVLRRLAEPTVLRTPHFEWLPRPSTAIAISVAGLWLVSALLFTIGWRVSITGPVLLGAIVFALALDQQMYSNHLYLLCWLVLLLTIADAGAGLNVGRRDRPVLRWPVLLLMLQASIVYGFSALTKLNADFLSGRVLGVALGTGPMPFPEALLTPQVLTVLAAGAVMTEFFVAIFIWRPRFRPAAFLLGLALHLSITLLMAGTLQLIVFSLEMLALYPLFLDTDKLTVDVSLKSYTRAFRRLDILQALDVVEKSPSLDSPGAVRLRHHGEITYGFAAVTRILEHLVPTLWFAPVLRVPGIKHLGERIYLWRDSGDSERLKPESSTAR